MVTRGLPAREYEVQVVNLNQPGGPANAPSPGLFALFDPAEACFYNFFESGNSQWQQDGDSGIVLLTEAVHAMTDSPEWNYDSAVSP